MIPDRRDVHLHRVPFTARDWFREKERWNSKTPPFPCWYRVTSGSVVSRPTPSLILVFGFLFVCFYVLLHVLRWHWVITECTFQVYTVRIRHLYIPLCAHHLRSVVVSFHGTLTAADPQLGGEGPSPPCGEYGGSQRTCRRG